MSSGDRDATKSDPGRRPARSGPKDHTVTNESGSPSPPASRSRSGRSGERMGPYRIIRELGRGGMGIVYLVEQDEPVRRSAALKIIQTYGDSTMQAAYLKRFRTECHTLARLKHPNVALVFDAGESDSGKPYFVMEYLEGRTLAEYCNQNKLNVTERLGLFIQVCRGVQHAHQRGIIHRDLKPSNIIVTEEEGRPIPKIIDFGVAKEIDAESSNTVQGELLGSPGFMSPEMLVGGAADVDSRTDVYSLGAVLFELLVDSPPFSRGDESFVQFLMRRVHEEPKTPSRWLKGHIDDVREIAARRAMDPEGLHKALHGDLDWITSKAMHKDRDQRYATASELAEDVSRHLRLEPVAASPLGRWYRMRRTVQRHRIGFALGATLAALLVAATITTSISLVRAVRSEQRAMASESAARLEADRTRAINLFLEDLLGALDPSREGRDVRLIDLVDRKAETIDRVFESQPEIEASVRHILGTTYLNLGEHEAAGEQLRTALELRRQHLGQHESETIQTRNEVSRWLLYGGRFDDSVALSRETLQIVDDTDAVGNDPIRLQTRIILGQGLYKNGDPEEAYTTFSTALALHEPQLGRDHPDVIRARSGLALALKSLRRMAEAEAIYRVTLAQQREFLGADHPETLRTLNALANTLFLQRKYEEAELLYRKTYSEQQRILGPDHPATLLTLNNIGNVLYKTGRYQEAEATYRQTLEKQVLLFGRDHPDALVTTNNLANSLRRQDRYRDAERLYRHTLEEQTTQLGPAHDETVRTALNLMTVLSRTGRYQEVIEMADYYSERRPNLEDPLLHKVDALFEIGRPAAAVQTLNRLTELLPEDFSIRAQLGLALLLAGRPDEAFTEYRQALELSPSQEQVEEEAIAPLRDAIGGGDRPVGSERILSLLQPRL